MIQTDRVLAMLQQRGEQGVNTTDFLAPACDGGKPILRVAARIQDLRDRGFAFLVQRRSNGTVTYVLLSEPEGNPSLPPPEALSASEDASGGLFDTDGFRARPGFFDVEAA